MNHSTKSGCALQQDPDISREVSGDLLYVQVTVRRYKLRIKQQTKCIKYPKFILS